MIDIFHTIEEWAEQKKSFALATVIRTWRSAPRMEGASMAISTQQDIVGSVSGGCVEGSVIREALEVLQSGIPRRLSFGVSNEDAWSVGLSCGGQIEVLVEPFFGQKHLDLWEKLEHCVRHNKGCVLLKRLDVEVPEYHLIFADGQSFAPLDDALKAQALHAYRQHKNQIITQEEAHYFAKTFPTKDRLLIIGAAHISVDLVDLAHQFNFKTTIVDPRGIFTNKMEFNTAPHAIHEKWPEEVLPHFDLDADTYAVVLSHDPKIDDQALHILLRSPVAD
ncbi:MAG: XdhC family protein, partial [Bacteroidota bacterium]